jgi:hypothetical protein
VPAVPGVLAVPRLRLLVPGVLDMGGVVLVVHHNSDLQVNSGS